MPNIWDNVPSQMRPLTPEEADMLRRRDSLLEQRSPVSAEQADILRRRDALLGPLQSRPAAANNAGPQDEMSPGGNQAAAHISRLDQQIVAIERDIQLRMQAKERLVAEKNAIAKAISSRK